MRKDKKETSMTNDRVVNQVVEEYFATKDWSYEFLEFKSMMEVYITICHTCMMLSSETLQITQGSFGFQAKSDIFAVWPPWMN